MTDRWIYVLLPYATFALRITDGVVAEAPPIARRWVLGKNERTAADLLRQRGATFREMPERSAS